MKFEPELVESTGDLLNLLTRLSRGEHSDPHVLGWYRGHADANWELVPEVMRKWFRDNDGVKDASRRVEFWLIENFQREGAHLFPASASTTVIYFLARHHALPTRLLDWSTNALVSLFFATAAYDDRDGVIYVLFPRMLDPDGPVNVRVPEVTLAISKMFEPSSGAAVGEARKVLPILPDATTGRMLQQGACFTFHPRANNDFNGVLIPEPAVRAFRIPSRAKPHIQRELRRAGIAWPVLFPDLDHLAVECRSRHGLFPKGDSSVAWSLRDDAL